MKRRRQGFTLIEVMISLAIAGSALVAIFAMQEAIARGNGLSREMTAATANTRMWIERLRRDSLLWTGDNAVALAQTSYLQQVGAGWIQPIPANPFPNFVEGSGADWSGNETNVAADQHFCTAINLTWIRQFQTMRADVVTYWSRQGRLDCANPAVGAVATPAQGIRQVAASTVLRRAR
ncbi:MAG: prepilin-type N-terminal cleavage/methylation domain-containing protein [Myxococcales bacterium]|nr:prepilin-type N-terminal cleavage/methylation domain-containing protein [Myxococcales bacterium]